MKNRDRIRERFLRDDLPLRLGGLAADLERIASSARRPGGADRVSEMLEESQYFIEWTAAETPIEVAAELVDMQLMIALWRGAWPEAQHSASQRLLLSVQAHQWMHRVLGFSGLISSDS